jgi:hypothetical protein
MAPLTTRHTVPAPICLTPGCLILETREHLNLDSLADERLPAPLYRMITTRNVLASVRAVALVLYPRSLVRQRAWQLLLGLELT